MAKMKKSQYRLDLEKEIKPMLQEANMKLLNIEKLAEKEGYEGIEGFAYRQAMQAIKEIRGKEYKRFNLPKNIHQLEKTKRSLERFLDAPTSTKAGIDELYEKNATFLNQKIGTKFDWQKMASFLQAANFEELKNDYDSKTAFLVVGQMYKHRRKTGKKKFIEMLEKHQIDGLDEVDSDTIAEFVKTDIKWTDIR